MDNEPLVSTPATPGSIATPADAPPPPFGHGGPEASPQPMGGSHPGGHYPLWTGQPYRPIPTWSGVPVPPRPKPKPKPYRPVEIAIALGVMLVADVAFWAGNDRAASGGFGLALLFTAVPTLLFLAARAWRGSVRLAVVAGLLVLVAARCVFDPTPGTVLSGLGLVAAFIVALRARSAFVPEIVRSVASAVPKLFSRINAAAAGVKALVARTRLGNVSVLPIVVPAALVAVFLGVFALANPVVAHALGTAWTFAARVLALPSAARIAFWVLVLAAAIALLRPTCRLATGSESAAGSGEATATTLLVTRNALAGLNVLFLAYNALDATYLWSGSPPTGMRTQQYAHQGAFWLTVALLMLTAVIGIMFRGPLAHDARAKTSRRLAYAWMAQGLVLALGTYRRIAIHIAKSGLSDLRIVGILGTTLVVCGVILVAWKLRERKTFTWLLRRQLDAFALTTVLYAVTPTHLVSARVNVARIQSGEYRPVLHAFRQSHETESAAAYLPLLDHPDVRVRQGVAALLEDEHARLRDERRRQTSWRERDVATGRALAALDAATDRIDAARAGASPVAAKHVLLEISRVANEDRSLEELLAIPAASDMETSRGDAQRY